MKADVLVLELTLLVGFPSAGTSLNGGSSRTTLFRYRDFVFAFFSHIAILYDSSGVRTRMITPSKY